MRRTCRNPAAALALCVIMLGAAGCERETAVHVPEIAEGGLIAALSTDRAMYGPGDAVRFTLEWKDGEKADAVLVRYRHLSGTVKEERLSAGSGRSLTWTWTPPTADGAGYMAEVFVKRDGAWVDHANIGVDVSSDWGKFPRYGYLADFGDVKPDEQQTVMSRLNRYHLNGLQFYDWQNKHHMPVPFDGSKPAAIWNDIANRTVLFDTVKRYIGMAHERGMKAMNYNLLFGALRDADKDGVKREWGLFQDPLHQNQDRHPLPSSWASDIRLMNPANPEWQAYLLEQEKRAFAVLPFDGWHVDQLGDRGALWDYAGNKVQLERSYGDFLKQAKSRLDVDYVMNAVSQVGQPYIAGAPVKFLYAELWQSQAKYRSLKDVIDQNRKYGAGKLQTVLAAYMDYDAASAPGEFNSPGVLLTDAVIFAAGGAHIELGESMLGKEYFPNRNLKMSPALEKRLIRYYDFMTAYENLLRGGAEELDAAGSIRSASGLKLSAQPETGSVWSFAKQQGATDVIHLINFVGTRSLDWRDLRGEQTEPQTQRDMRFTLPDADKVRTVWIASPDRHQGSPVPLPFERTKEGGITFKVPELQYWDMLVVERDK